jgi:thiaminase
MSLINLWGLDKAFREASSEAQFISHLASGSIPQKNFDAWLYNDFVYARGCSYLIARLIASLPSINDYPSSSTNREFLEGLRASLLGGYKVIQQELDVFKSKASHRGVPLPIVSSVSPDYELEAAKPQTQAYSELSSLKIDERCREYLEWMMIELFSKSKEGIHNKYHWTTLLAAVWMLEKVYCEAMWAVKLGSGFNKLDENTRDLISWWAKEEFKEYVEFLQHATETARKGEWGWREEEAEGIIKDVLKLEVGFWSIAEEDLGL